MRAEQHGWRLEQKRQAVSNFRSKSDWGVFKCGCLCSWLDFPTMAAVITLPSLALQRSDSVTVKWCCANPKVTLSGLAVSVPCLLEVLARDEGGGERSQDRKEWYQFINTISWFYHWAKQTLQMHIGHQHSSYVIIYWIVELKNINSVSNNCYNILFTQNVF